MSSTLNDNVQKTPLALSLQKLGQAKANDAVEGQGKCLPCTVSAVVSPSVVTVNFAVATSPSVLPKITMPVQKPPYIQYPIQVGDIGLAIPASVRIGGLTGLGAGTPNLKDTVGNLSALSFVWLGKSGDTFIDPDALVLYNNIVCTPSQLSFFAASKVAKQTVSGPLSSVTDASAKAVLTSLITALANYGLIENSTS